VAINNSLLRRNLRELTYAFIQPFQKYFSGTEQTPSPPKPTKNAGETIPPILQAASHTRFSEQEFVKDLKRSSNIFPFMKYATRKKAINLYTRFLRSSTFHAWFAAER
jgi:hypothetical protein